MMSKAFTREDDLPDGPVMRRPPSPLPAGTKNYLTSDGATRLKEELHHLLETERPQAASVDRDRLPALDERIAHLRHALETAIVVNPTSQGADKVRFGCSVKVREENSEETVYRIVGVDEIDLESNRISWLSPLARALMNGRVGDHIRLKLPGRETELKILEISCH